MEKLNKFHPIITENYIFRFLNEIPGKQTQDFLKLSTMDSAKYINHSMVDIMNDKSITWGIVEKQFQSLIGIVICTINSSNDATVNFNFKRPVPFEVMNRVKYFVKRQLNISQVSIDKGSSDFQSIDQFFND